MEVIPVVDLLGGVVVHARRGQRDAYRPIESPLSQTNAPGDVAAGLLRLFPFRGLYIADLDAIAGRPGNVAGLAALGERPLGLWVDAGVADEGAARERLAMENISVVIGSESQTGTELAYALRNHPRTVLSLDFRGDAFQGPEALLTDTALWPGRVIVMTLSRVGAQLGPDIARVAAIAARADRRAVYAAGGVRDITDLRALSVAGAAGALVATALHDGSLTASDLRVLTPSP